MRCAKRDWRAEEQVLANVAAQIGRAADLAALRGLEGAAAAHYSVVRARVLPDSWGLFGAQPQAAA